MAEDKKIETYTETSKYLEELKDTLPYYKDILLAFDNGTATVNTETCEAIGFDFEEIKKVFGPLCTQVNGIETAESFE